jgi:predicted component of type VI protein secretion system
MKLSLIVAKGKRKGKIISVAVPQFIIGRHKECHLRPGSAAISQHHCALLSRGTKIFVRDFDSTNGTFVNQKRVQGEQELAEDDLVEIGSLAFRIHIESEADEPALSVPPVGSEADDSMVADILLKESEGSPGILGLVEDSRCGSTVLRSPLASPEENEESPESSSPPGEIAPPPAGDHVELAKEILERFERSVREKYNRP